MLAPHPSVRAKSRRAFSMMQMLAIALTCVMPSFALHVHLSQAIVKAPTIEYQTISATHYCMHKNGGVPYRCLVDPMELDKVSQGAYATKCEAYCSEFTWCIASADSTKFPAQHCALIATNLDNRTSTEAKEMKNSPCDDLGSLSKMGWGPVITDIGDLTDRKFNGELAYPGHSCMAKCAMGTCTVSEDPHIQVFDGTQIGLRQFSTSAKTVSDEEAGDKWLVKSNLISIQARYLPNNNLPQRNLFVRALAVGGAFLKDNTLVIGSLEDQVTWNGEAILEDQSSSFSLSDGKFFMKARRSTNSSLVQDSSKRNPGVDVELPLGLSLIVNRLSRHINVAIKMPQQEGGQDGLCGNFNRLGSDDAIEMSGRRMSHNVLAEESLFQSQIHAGD